MERGEGGCVTTIRLFSRQKIMRGSLVRRIERGGRARHVASRFYDQVELSARECTQIVTDLAMRDCAWLNGNL